MNEQASFTLRARNPDVLTCIANLSNDEVFTPPEFANRMLDTLAEAWAANNGGADIWADKTVKFLDPCTKSGVFLREITSRLTRGLEKQIPDLEKRVDHILTKQVFGIGITQITSLLARRSVYCSRHAQGKHSIAKSFANEDGNIWFQRIKHTWDGDKCKYCGAGRSVFDRAKGLETHAYTFHSHRQDQNSARRDIWKHYAIRRHHWKSTVSVGKRRRHTRHSHLQQVCGTGHETTAALSLDGYSVSLDGFGSWSERFPQGHARRPTY
jgi:hypothetical protein